MDIQTQQLLLNRLAQVQPQLALDQVIAYHGTRSSALQSIRDNGILSHPFKHYHPSRFYKGARGASVYVTENPNIATQWALSEVDDPSLATILQVVVPREGLYQDEEAPEAERFLGDIPPEWIQATYQILPDGSLGPAVPFHADPRLSQAAEDDTKSKRFMVIQHKGGWSVPRFAQDAAAKLPKDQVEFEHPAQGPHHCGECQHFITVNACEIVEGLIRSEDWCDKFAKKTAMDSALVSLRQWALRRLAQPHKLVDTLAMDRAFVPLKSERSVIAMDRGPTSRVKTEDGHLHVGLSNISKATVNPYWGREIPNFEKLGLQPDKKYMLLRHPDELAKAAKTFNNLPILAEHTPITSDKHPSELVVGSTGTDAVYKHPYLRNSLVFWPQPAIDAIEDNAQREISAAYHYDPKMTSGIYEGQKYDGIMTHIRGNHIALVVDGRAGSDVVVADSTPGDLFDDQWKALEQALLAI